jgi:hypothetical protein
MDAHRDTESPCLCLVPLGCGRSSCRYGLKLSRFLNSMVMASFTLLALLGLS